MADYNPYSANQQPDLSLAMTPDVASGDQQTNMPIALPPIPRNPEPSLSPGYDIYKMGIVDTVPFDNLNLAGINPLPAAPYEASQSNEVNYPTFGVPDFTVPPCLPYDLTGPGIDHIPEFQVDPQVGDLLQFDRPHGLDITAASNNPLAVDPMHPDLSLYDRPSNLAMPDPMMVDPSLPDLQSPELEQEIHMPGRPGEMGDGDDDSLEEDLGPDNDGDDDDGPEPEYEENNMTPGMTRREKKMNVVYKGLRDGSLR